MERFKKNNPTYFRDYARKYKQEHPSTSRERKHQQLRWSFGITIDTYEKMLAEQHGVCAVCKGPPGKKALAVDHCHESGLIRGLLCDACNTALGLLRECPTRMDALKDYINAFRWLK